ncbi:hypothetical protein SLAV_22535 [Streptomyces lavendulae subsp. lavendulae]|uniref:Uncharacterized protein n=2 Tax=Streptomyces lavendulae TaxID=1914 RepID=A0A2K8PHW2_STRLA|nr:hypothetical protein SLAV_22535 [Streptomyces lavendulae subsp. lavendulae]QUQ56149.1 hypothetical protein SLLC_20645 [Streptomyces lavendulae subsp. lavendulae]
MHGPGLPPQQGPHGHRSLSGSEMTLRVLFTALPLLSCGFFAWGSMLRLAILTRKGRDWALLVITGVLSVVWLTLIEMDPTAEVNGWQGNLGAGGSIFTGFAICVYHLVADIRHHENKRPAPAVGAAPWYPAGPQTPYGGQQTVPSYGYPPAGNPTPVPAPPQVPPQTPPPPRLGQVRAELDELSELLRRQGQGQGPGREQQGPARPPQPPRPGGPYQDPNSTAFQDPNR